MTRVRWVSAAAVDVPYTRYGGEQPAPSTYTPTPTNTPTCTPTYTFTPTPNNRLNNTRRVTLMKVLLCLTHFVKYLCIRPNYATLL